MSEHSRPSHRAPHEYKLPSSHGSSRHSRSASSLHPEDIPLPPKSLSSRHGSKRSPVQSSHNSPAHSSHHSKHSHHSHRSHASGPAALGIRHPPPSHASGSPNLQLTFGSTDKSSSSSSSSSGRGSRHPFRKLYDNWFGGSSPYTSLNITSAHPKNKLRTTPYIYIRTDWEEAVQDKRRDAREGIIPQRKYMVKGKGKHKGTWSTKWL